MPTRPMTREDVFAAQKSLKTCKRPQDYENLALEYGNRLVDRLIGALPREYTYEQAPDRLRHGAD